MNNYMRRIIREVYLNLVKFSLVKRTKNCMKFQTRSETSGLGVYNSMDDALEASQKDKTIWKISFIVDNEHIRLVKRLKFTDGIIEQYHWVYEHIYS